MSRGTMAWSGVREAQLASVGLQDGTIGASEASAMQERAGPLVYVRLCVMGALRG